MPEAHLGHCRARNVGHAVGLLTGSPSSFVRSLGRRVFLEEVDVCFLIRGCGYDRRIWGGMVYRVVDVREDPSTWFGSGSRHCRTFGRGVGCLEDLGRSAGLSDPGS